MQSAYLCMVTPDNHNKYYKMIPHVPDASHFTVEYGRVGASGMKKIYPFHTWDKIYQEKLNKGYTNQSHLHNIVVDIMVGNGYKPIDDAVVHELISRLLAYADEKLKSSYKISEESVTQSMIEVARDYVDDLSYEESVIAFNEILLKLFSVLPRKMKNVDDYLAKSQDDFLEIIDREESLLDIMAGKVRSYVSSAKASGKSTILESYGIEVRECNHDEKEMIKKFLTEESSCIFKNAYYVKNIETEEKFNVYCQQNRIDKKDIHFLYHGSRNENWLYILRDGLKIRPKKKVVRTGAMFGTGLYFAKRAKKSIGYTSFGYWTKGNSNTGFLAVYKVAYKNPYRVFSHISRYTQFSNKDMVKMGCDALYADSSQGMLLNDEIIIYNDEQATIRYLIEVENKKGN